MSIEEALRREIVEFSHKLWQRGWVANHDGNLSARLPPADGEPERFLATPTRVSKGEVRPEWLIVVDAERNVLQGTRRPFSEFALHLAAYAARPDIGAVIHAHPPTATGFAVAGVELGHPFMAEPVVSLGPRIPVVPYHRPGDPAVEEALGGALADADVVLLDRHGVLSVGGGFEQAYLRMELVEHLARIALVARQLGGTRPLPEEDVAALSKKGRPASSPSHGSAPGASAALSDRRPDVHALVAEALKRLG